MELPLATSSTAGGLSPEQFQQLAALPSDTTQVVLYALQNDIQGNGYNAFNLNEVDAQSLYVGSYFSVSYADISQIGSINYLSFQDGSYQSTGYSPGDFGGQLVGAEDVPTAKSLLGLGTMAIQNASAASITGGTISGLAKLSATSIVSGGTSLSGDLVFSPQTNTPGASFRCSDATGLYLSSPLDGTTSYMRSFVGTGISYNRATTTFVAGDTQYNAIFVDNGSGISFASASGQTVGASITPGQLRSAVRLTINSTGTFNFNNRITTPDNQDTVNTPTAGLFEATGFGYAVQSPIDGATGYARAMFTGGLQYNSSTQLYSTSFSNWGGVFVDNAGNVAIGGETGASATRTIAQVTAAAIAKITIADKSLNAPHFGGSSATPTMTAGAAAGTSPTITVAGNDVAGEITLTIGTLPVSGTLFTITFNSAYGTAPRIVFSRSGAAAATGISSSSTTSTFALATDAALTAGTQYKWTYHAIK